MGIPQKLHRQLAKELAIAMRKGVSDNSAGNTLDGRRFVAPDRYTLILPTAQANLLLTHPAELDRLTRSLENEASQAGIPFAGPPLLRVVAAPQSAGVKVISENTWVDQGDGQTTGMMGTSARPNPPNPGAMPKAFLIVNGLTTFAIDQPVINIGRDPSNQLHLDDRRVSRLHAQLRLVQGRFVIFDLDSKGGTIVNGVAVSSHVLNAGDVVLLGGVPLVYGQEQDAQAGYTQELPSDPPPPEIL